MTEPKSEWSDFFRYQISLGKPMPYRRTECHDCAVTHGLYLEISEALALEPAEIQEKVSRNWFCHNNVDRACRGNLNNLKAYSNRFR